jgi:hypothetical protein
VPHGEILELYNQVPQAHHPPWTLSLGSPIPRPTFCACLPAFMCSSRSSVVGWFLRCACGKPLLAASCVDVLVVLRHPKPVACFIDVRVFLSGRVLFVNSFKTQQMASHARKLLGPARLVTAALEFVSGRGARSLQHHIQQRPRRPAEPNTSNQPNQRQTEHGVQHV